MSILKDDLIKYRSQGLTNKEIGKKLGVSKTTIGRYVQKYGLSKPVDRTDILDEDVLNDYNSGLTINEIADKYNASHDTITKRLKKYDISNTRAEGIKRHFKPTYEERWVDIKKDLDQGYSKTFVRNKYKIRIENLNDLMEKHGYFFPGDAYENRVKKKIKQLEHDVDKNGRFKYRLKYMESLLDFYQRYERIPSRKEFSRHIGFAYTNVCQMIKRHGWGTFFLNSQMSDYERMFIDRLDLEEIEYLRNDRKCLEGLEVDFYLPKYNLAIELNPWRYHCIEHLKENNRGGRAYHQRKSLLAREQEMGLIHLYDWDFNTETLDKLFLWIKHNPEYKIGARECDVQILNDKKLVRSFLSSYHFMSEKVNYKMGVGLFYRGDLVGVMLFDKSRYSKSFDWELVRYCMHPNYIIMGCFQKMLSLAKKNGVEGKIGVYMDLNKRFIPRSIYDKSFFDYVKVTIPNYKWVTSGGKTKSRYETTKTKLIKQGFDPNMTEREIMHSLDSYQVYDAGSILYEFNL